LVPVPPRAIDPAALQEIAEAFHDRHWHTYGHDNRSEPVQIVNIRLAAVGAMVPLVIRDKAALSATDAVKSKRPVWFRATGAVDATIYDRRRLPAEWEAPGPVVIESLESTILVPPGWQAKMDGDGFVVLTRLQERAKQR
jgi:N-methylhydantoinase A